MDAHNNNNNNMLKGMNKLIALKKSLIANEYSIPGSLSRF